MKFKTYKIDSAVCNQGSHQDRLHNCDWGFKSQDNCVQFSDFKKLNSNRFNSPNEKRFSDRNRRY